MIPFIQQLHDDELAEGYFQQDGATPHCTGENLWMLRQYFADRIMSRNTGRIFPARSCDLTPCDYFLWPYLKNTIFTSPISDLEDLKERIQLKFEEINDNSNMLRNCMTGLERRMLMCIQEGGGHFQPLL